LTQDLPGLLKLNRKLAEPAIKMLTRAFWNYPILTYYFPEESLRRSISESMLAFPIYTCLRYGEIYATSQQLEGAAVWTLSEKYPVSLWGILRTVPLRYIFSMTRSGMARMQTVDRFLNDIHKRLVPYSHMYLEILGVDPKYQKQGFSSKLMKPMVQRLDRQELPCFLETQDPQDVPIYQHFGFEIIDQSAIPESPLTSWALLRKPLKEFSQRSHSA
jgi:GNAT superfamily N-acetyltransferase